MTDFAEKLDSAIRDWQAAKEAAQGATQNERAMRARIVDQFFDSDIYETTQKAVGNEFVVTCRQGVSRTLDEPLLEMALSEARKLQVDTDLLVRMQPKLNLAAYKSLTDEQKNAVSEAVIAKPSMPILTAKPV